MEQKQHEAQPVVFPQLTEATGEQHDGGAVPWEVLATLELPVHVEPVSYTHLTLCIRDRWNSVGLKSPFRNCLN